MAEKTKQPSQRPRFEIRTPVRGFTGVRAGVAFNGGVGHTDDEERAFELAGMGYDVQDAFAPAKKGS